MSSASPSFEEIENAPFGTVFSDTMAITYFKNGAWSDVKVQPVAPFSMHPAAHVLHYSSTVFEGLKAYSRPDGSAQIFRLDRHVARMAQSADLLCLECPPEAVIDDMIRRAVDSNRASIPAPPGALYIRPTLIGLEPNVGAAATRSSEVCFYILNCPVGSYFKGGERALRILLEDKEMRSTPGFGRAKTGGNYASALRHALRGKKEYQADQVLFCPGDDVQETGASNFMLINDKEVLTKPLNEAFLHGVTRDSVLHLARDMGYNVIERDFGVADIFEWIKTGEAALSGTAAVLSSVGTMIHNGKEYTVGDGQVGKNTVRIRKALSDIQHGEAPDRFGWLTEV